MHKAYNLLMLFGSFLVFLFLCCTFVEGQNKPCLDPAALAPNYDTINLDGGFGFLTFNMTSGGNESVQCVSASAGCKGYATQIPDIRINYRSNPLSTYFLRFYFLSLDPSKDTTMVVYLQNRIIWLCSDNTSNPGLCESLDPTIDIVYPSEENQYDVWVGSRNENEFIRGIFVVTEWDFLTACGTRLL